MNLIKTILGWVFGTMIAIFFGILVLFLINISKGDSETTENSSESKQNNAQAGNSGFVSNESQFTTPHMEVIDYPCRIETFGKPVWEKWRTSDGKRDTMIYYSGFGDPHTEGVGSGPVDITSANEAEPNIPFIIKKL